MADNSNNRKKTLIVSMLAFLFIGGGVFLFFIIQGSDDLTGAKKNNFRYGGAAREGVSSFFKAMGIIPDEEEITAKRKENRMETRGFLLDGEKAVADVSDWMASSSAKAASPRASGRSTNVPRMAHKGGLSGGSAGASKSAGASGFGGGSDTGNTKISAKTTTAAGANAGKGTLGALKNARAMLGEGLRSDSAMTAKSKWGQSFGVGGSARGSSGDLAYNKIGLVGLDKIKSGEISSLKPVPEAGAFERDKEAESKDAGLNAAKKDAAAKSKADAEAAKKKEVAKALIDAAGQGLEKGMKPDSPAEGGIDPGQAPITDEEKEEAKNLAFFNPEKSGDGTETWQDSKVDITRTSDGGAKYSISGETTTSTGEKIPYTDVVVRAPDGTLTFK